MADPIYWRGHTLEPALVGWQLSHPAFLVTLYALESGYHAILQIAGGPAGSGASKVAPVEALELARAQLVDSFAELDEGRRLLLGEEP